MMNQVTCSIILLPCHRFNPVLDIVPWKSKLVYGHRMEIVAGVLLLFFLAVLARRIGNRLVPLAMPGGRLKTVAAGFSGGVVGSLVDRFTWECGPEVVGVHLAASIIGCILFIIGYGLVPFVRIMMGRV